MGGGVWGVGRESEEAEYDEEGDEGTERVGLRPDSDPSARGAAMTPVTPGQPARRFSIARVVAFL